MCYGKVPLLEGWEWPERKDMPMPKKEGGDMERLEKEMCQPDGTVILENLISLSRDYGIPVTIKTGQGDVYTGKLLSSVPFCAATVGVPALYIRLDIEGSQLHESHAVIPVSSIDSLTFATEKGLLDNLVK